MKLFLVAALTALSASALAAPAGNAELSISSGVEVQRDVSQPMRDIIADLAANPGTSAPVSPQVASETEIPNIILSFQDLFGLLPAGRADGNFQRAPSGNPAPAPIANFNGMRIGLGGGGVPPDTTGDVSPAHYFQWVNSSWSLFDKVTGNRVSGPTTGNTFFSGFGGLCQTTNRGDPLVLWDDDAERWVVSQFAFSSTTSNGTFLQCLAVSTTADPLGTYNRYAFAYPTNRFNDYGKMGIWRSADGSQNAYLLTMHEFQPAATPTFQGESFAVVERDKMLAGETAQFVRVGGVPTFGALPFHMEGKGAAPGGACPIFVHFAPSGAGYNLWDMCIDWSSGTVDFDPEPTLVASEPFGLNVNGIPQPGQTNQLDDFQSNTMYIATVRAFEGVGPKEVHGAIFHTASVDGTRAGARWIRFGFNQGSPQADGVFADGFAPDELRPVAPNVMAKRIIDQGTYAPGADYRWMGSINIDQNLNLGMGYSASGTTNPEVRITGKLLSDAPGSMRDEQSCTPGGTGAQLGGTFGRPLARWGDYASTGVDPTDDCTFWHTNEYFTVSSQTNWDTRICSFKFAQCGTPALVVETPSAPVNVCSSDAADPVFAVRVGALGGLTADATLSASGFPAGVTPSFSPVSVAPGARSIVTLTGARTAAPGVYSGGTIIGTAGPASGGGPVVLGVSAAPSAAPVLLTPASGGASSIRPSLRWQASVGAITYRVELALDAGFTQIVDDAVVEDTRFSPSAALLSNTQYFWRVTAQNFCGDGAPAATSSFTTAEPNVCAAGTSLQPFFSDDVSGDAIAWVTNPAAPGDSGANWTKRVPPAGTGLATRAWFAGNSSTTADQPLTSPAIVLPAVGQLTLTYDAYHQYETDGANNCWDGASVEISADAGATFFPLGNQRNLRDPYPGTLSSGNPAAPSEAWCRQPAGGNSVETVFTLDEFAGQSILIRFRSSADSNTVGPTPNGWGVDNIRVQGCVTVP